MKQASAVNDQSRNLIDLQMDSKSKIIWIGPYVSSQAMESLMKDRCFDQMAANRVQSYYLKGLFQLGNPEIDVLSALVTIPFPDGTRKIIRINDDSNETGGTIRNVPYINIPPLNIISQSIMMAQYGKRVAKSLLSDDKEALVFVYSMRLPLFCAARQFRRKGNRATIINIIPDLPQYMHFEEKGIRKSIRKLYIRCLNAAQRCVDGYVLYTGQMIEMLERKPYVVIEGLFDKCSSVSDTQESALAEKNMQTIVYAGSIEAKYGLDILVEGFIAANVPNMELHVYGSGSYVETLLDFEKNYPNVKYMGLASPDEAYKAISRADLVVNPRPSSSKFTEFSFPSKVFEYMSSGTPVLMTRLPGVGEEYYRYVYTIEDETARGVRDAILKVFSINPEERDALADRARTYIFNNKNIVIQVSKLMNFSERLKVRNVSAKESI